MQRGLRVGEITEIFGTGGNLDTHRNRTVRYTGATSAPSVS